MKSKKIIRSKSSILKRKSSRVKTKRCKRNYRGGKRKKSKSKNKKIKSKSKSICYTGVNSNKLGQYDEKDFLKLMNDKFKNSCGRSLNEKNCKPCQNHKEMSKKFKEMMKNPLINDDEIDMHEYNMDFESIKCEMCKNKNIKSCNLKDYINYSGATYGRC